MQKKIIALAIASALTAPAAFADTSNVTVYGVANVSYDMTNTGSGTVGGVAVQGFNSNKVSSNTSRLGLKGSEDLGDGLSAIWQIESLINIDNAGAGAPGQTGTTTGNTLGGRNTFAGLSSASAGTLLLGRHDTPYNISNRKYDLFTDGIADNRSIMGGGANVAASFDGRQPNVVAYISPAFSGFTGAVAYVAGAEGQTLATQTKGSAWSLAALYGNGPISANVGYEVHNIGTAAGTLGAAIAAGTSLKESAWTISGGYKVEAFEVNAVYEKTQDNFGGSVLAPGLVAGSDALGHSAYYLAGKYNFGSNAVKLAYTYASKEAGYVNTGATQVSVGFDHSLSKRTTVYALYTQLSNKAGDFYGLSTNGTGAPAVNVVGLGAKPSAVSLGLKHTF